MNLRPALFSLWLISFFIASCENENTTQTNTVEEIIPPDFNADTAFSFIEKQLAFGPRVPGSPAQQKCATFIEQEIKKYCDTVYTQKVEVTQPISNKKYPCINIIGSINPQALSRILILAHWDSRPWADQDDVNQNEPIQGADDGASGVAVMLEMARVISKQKPDNLGIDFLFVDVEDVGKTEWTEQSYSLGTQYWAKNMHHAGYKAHFGICLDMVGARGAQFFLEALSKSVAPDKQRLVWDNGNKLGYSDYFKYIDGGMITDDHAVVNELAGIPTIDIINLQEGGSFGTYWHTHDDNIQIIDKNTLKAVGHTVLYTLYNY